MYKRIKKAIATAVATHFLNILQKYYQLPILGTLDMSGHFHQTQLCQLVETDVNLHAKNEVHP